MAGPLITFFAHPAAMNTLAALESALKDKKARVSYVHRPEDLDAQADRPDLGVIAVALNLPIRASILCAVSEEWQGVRYAEAQGVPLLAPSAAYETVANKYLGHRLLRATGLRQPVSWLAGEDHPTDVPLVVKPNFGGLSRDLHRIEPGEPVPPAPALDPWLVQEFIPHSMTVSTLATPERLLSAARMPGDVRIVGKPAMNLAGPVAHGSSEWDEIEEAACAMVRATGLRLGRADLILGPGGELIALDVHAWVRMAAAVMDQLRLIADELIRLART